MGKLTKNQKLALSKIEPGKAYTLAEAAAKVKEISFEKFDSSFDIDVRLGVDPRKADQMVRGVVSLPHGTGKQVRVLVLCGPDAEAAATEAGADYVGLDEYIEKIKGGWTDVDVIITQPMIMGKIDFKVDKNGIVHSSIGKVSFTPQQMQENAREFINTLIKLKPATAKGTYIKSIYLSSTMGPGIKVDSKTIDEKSLKRLRQ